MICVWLNFYSKGFITKLKQTLISESILANTKKTGKVKYSSELSKCEILIENSKNSDHSSDVVRFIWY